MSDSFVHLKLHSEYSIRDGIVRIPNLVQRVKALDMSAVAMTDSGNLFGMVKFYRQALQQGIKPIIGADIYITQDQQQFNATLLCQNQIGYRNLTQLLSRGYLEGQTREGLPTVCWDWLKESSEGLIALSGGHKGDVGSALLSGKEHIALQLAQRWQHCFADRFYIELQRCARSQEEDYLHLALSLAEQLQLPVVATNAVCFQDRDDFEAHEARVCIHDGYVLEDSQRPRLYSEQQYLKSPEEMTQLFSDIPEALENTVAIAKRCNLTLSLGKPCLPQFPLPEGVLVEDYFREEANTGLQKRLRQTNKHDPESIKLYQQRLDDELNVILRMGFSGYFLIVADFIRWAKEHHIPVGPGRGSGAGSLVAYSLGITGLDPIEHELLFERFLNPERVSMPDFDIDFCMDQRDDVIDYVAKRYGRDAVSQIITYGTMAAKAVVRDVGRVLGLPYGFVDKIAKLIPFELGMTLEKALAQEAQLKARYKEEEEVTTLINLARKLEGITRNAGKHAGGVVIAPTKLTDFTPLYCEPEGTHLVTQFDKDDVEAVGLVKFDFLGLRTLTIIDWALRRVNKKRLKTGLDSLSIDDLPLDDKDTFTLLQSCATTAVFQLESRGMKELIRRLQPDSFDDITALVALFRPGPLQSGMVDDFIDRKHGRASVNYLHPDLETILRPTYGVILYQEQVMQIAQTLAGYSLGGADILRRAMGKKKPEEMAKQRAIFTEGAVLRGIDARVAKPIFDLMEKFAGYGFNKSHSAAYALIAYQTAWLKTHYPAEFMAAVLSSDMDNTDKVVSFLDECKRMKLSVQPPNINVGYYDFTVNHKGEIEYGLGAIKGAGESAMQHVVSEREKNGPYANLFEFCQRVDLHKVNRRVLEPLILSGAMDVFSQSRENTMASLDKASKMAEQKRRDETLGQGDLFGISAQDSQKEQHVSYIEASPWSKKVRLQGEKNTLGFYLSGHPIQIYEKELESMISASIDQLNTYLKKNVTIAGMLISIRTLVTRSGRRMAILNIEDRSGRIEVTLFSKLYDEIRHNLMKDQVYLIKGKIENDDYTGGVRMLAESVKLFEKVRVQCAKRLLISVEHQNQIEKILQILPELMQTHSNGSCPISIAYQGSQAKAELQLGERWRASLEDEFLEKLTRICGADSVIVEY